MDSSKRNPLAMRILPKDSDEEASPQESPSGRPSPRKRMCRNEGSKVGQMQESPLCVASMANLFLPEDLKLNSPRNFHSEELHTAHTILAAPDMMPLLQAEACNKDADDLDFSDHFDHFFELDNMDLMHALQKARADDFVVFDDGYLRAHVASLMMRLYAHVLAQGDDDDGGIYGPSSTLDPHTQLPVYFPADDPQDAGLTRVLRLSLALECDAWQWYAVAHQDFSLLDTLVWMGVQMQRFFQDSYAEPANLAARF